MCHDVSGVLKTSVDLRNVARAHRCEGYSEKGKAKTIGKGSGKAPAKPSVMKVMKVAMKVAKVKATAMKAPGQTTSLRHTV